MIDTFMSVSLVTDPLSGKTLTMLEKGEELDVGQIKEFNEDEIIELGLDYFKSPLYMYFDGESFKVSESRTRSFEDIGKLKDFIDGGDSKILCRWIRQHVINGRCVISYFPDILSHDGALSESLIKIRSEINNLITQHIPEGKGFPSDLDGSTICLEILNTIRSYPYEDKKQYIGDLGVAELLEIYEKTGQIKSDN